MLVAVIFFLFISLAIIAGLVSPSVREFRTANVNLNSKKSYFLSESGSEDAVYRIKKSMTIGASETITLNSNSATTTITAVSASEKEISSLGNVSSLQRKTKITISTAPGVSFGYGVQVGAGGLRMDNNSQVNGNVYSNGNIVGNNGARITGTAIATGATGKIDAIQVDQNATAHFLEDITVNGSTSSASLLRATVSGNAVSDSISDCTINGSATYDTKTNCTVSGTQTTPNLSNFEDPVAEEFPISEEQIDAWEADATAGGTINSYTLDDDAAFLGPKKINGNLTLSNNATLILTGTVWVTGTINASNGSMIKLDLSYGALSGVIIAGTGGSSSAGEITFSNNSEAQGSGTAGSYMLVLSQRNNTSSTAITQSNNASSAILYAPEGVVEISNNATMKEVTAYKIHLSNGAVISYESGLANINFSGGPSGGWFVDEWKEDQ